MNNNRSKMYWLIGNCVLLAIILAGCSKSVGQTNNNSNTRYTWQEFSMGADLSYVNIVEASGAVYKENGKQDDPYAILQRNGCNTVRVRLWHNPTWQNSLNGGLIFSNLADATRTIRRAKAAGMAVNLDLHYSDTWADPQHQEIPAAWRGLSLATMADSVYRYTSFVLNHLASQGLTPEMIQVGNETNTGMLWPVGNTETAGWPAFATLLKAGIKAVRDFSATSSIKPLIILHEAQLQTAEFWTRQLLAQGVTDFDILGLSHYFKWSTANSWSEVTRVLQTLRSISGKQVMIVETAFPFTNENADRYNNILWEASGSAVGYPFTPAGQRQYYTDLCRAVWQAGGKGVMLWEPAWLTSRLNDGWNVGSSWENNALFNFQGELHEGIRFATEAYK